MMSNHCKVKILRDDAILPARATAKAAGYDVCIPKEDWVREISPGDVLSIGTGLAFEIPDNLAMLVLPRSGMAIKKGLRPANTPGLIDPDYRGELIIGLENFGHEVRELSPGMAIAQVVFIERKFVRFMVVGELSDTERGEGGFGSTGETR